MMGRQPANQGKLFYYDISLERRIPAKHLLRQIKEAQNSCDHGIGGSSDGGGSSGGCGAA